MLKVEIAISLKIGFRIGFCPRLKPPVNGPVGSVNGCTANAVSVLLQERTHAISFFDRVAFFEEWITKKTHKIGIISNQRLIFEAVGVVVFVCVEIEM